MNIWKKVNEGSGNKLGIVRDYDNQPNAKKQHDKYKEDLFMSRWLLNKIQ